MPGHVERRGDQQATFAQPGIDHLLGERCVLDAGWVRSSTWIGLFSSNERTTAWEGLMPSEMKRLRQLEEENGKLHSIGGDGNEATEIDDGAL